MTDQEFRTTYYAKAQQQTLETLPTFFKEVFGGGMNYNTICYAVTACALAAAWAANHHPKGGITSFQAGVVMWEFIKEWSYRNNKTGLRLIDYDNMLYQQYEHDFEKTIRRETFEALQKEAQRRLDEDAAAEAKYAIDIEQYKKYLAAFIEKHPDYNERPEYYEHLSMGTGAEWEAEQKKEVSGFEFAPRKPLYFKPCQIDHWKSIVAGIVPFGYSIETK